VVPRLFLDPLGPQKEDQFHLGLPSLRHILDGPETPAASDGAVKPPPDVSQDHAIVNRLEALQRDATECWAKSATALNADEKAVLNDTVGTLWHTAVSLVAELLRSHKKLRQAGNLHRGSLGEIDRLRKHSEDQEGRVVEQKEAASVEIQELRRENVFLHQQLAMRDLESRSGDEPSPEAKSLAMGTWVAKQPFLPNSSTQGARPAALLQALEEEEEVQPEAQPGQMASVAKLLDWPAIHPAPKERPWEDDVHSQRLWQPDPKSSPELEQKISQLRDRLAHEVFEKEVLRERLEQLEREVALLHAFEVVDEPSDADSMAEAATKRLAELVGVRAALKTAQQSYESDKGYYASIQGRCDELEGRLEERDGVVEKLGRELKEVQAELQEERRELNEARFEAEEREGVVEDLKGQVMAMAKEVARAEVEMDMLVGELKATQAELAHARNKIQKLEDDLYDRDTRIGELIQDLDYERNERARAEAEFRVIKVELSSSVDALAEQCAAQERQIEDYKRTITQHEAVVAQLEQDYDLLNNHFMDEGVKRLDLAEQVKAQQVKITQLMRELRSYADINKRLAQHLKSLGQEEGWQRLEELRLRCEKLEEHRAAFAPTIFDLAREKERAQLRYEHDHRALAGAQADLKKLRQQRGYDIKRQTQLLARIAYLEQAYERAKHALQIAQLRLAGAKQIDGAHAREIEDLEAILRAMRGQETGTSQDAGTMPGY
jgi:predicted  nucleic acid-binding Zn-ribbon protein